MSPKTADYIPSGGGVIATLLGCTLMTLLWRTLLQREALKVFRENMDCSAITVYSLAIPCFSSRRVSIDSRVWNRNADDCFYRIVSWKSGVYPGRERLHTVCGRSTLQLTLNNYRAWEFTSKEAIWLDVRRSWPLKTRRLHSINGHFSTSRWRYMVTVAKQNDYVVKWYRLT